MNFSIAAFLQSELLPIGAGLKEVVAIVVIVIVLVFVLRVLYKFLPIWKELKLAELGVRGKEAEAQVQVANALGGLGVALNQIGSTMQNVAIEQRKATENVKILQRATAEENNNLIGSVDALSENVSSLSKRMDAYDELFKEGNKE